MYQFILPDIGEGVVEAEVIHWHVKEGDCVIENAVLVELMTDKATVEIPSPKMGRIHKLCFAEGSIVQVGHVLLEIEEGVQSEASPKRTGTPAIPKSNVPADHPTSAKPAAIVHIPAYADVQLNTREEKILMDTMGVAPPTLPPRPHRDIPLPPQVHVQPLLTATPAVREFAKQNGVDIHALTGTGPQGRVMKKDILDFMQNKVRPQPNKSSTPSQPAIPPADPNDWTRTPLRGLRRAIAQRMAHSVHTAAHYTYVEEVDMTDLNSLRDSMLKNGRSISPLAFITLACIQCLPEYPMLNSSLDDANEEIIIKKKIHIGIATATKDGLVVPVIHDADQYSLSDLSDVISSLAERARSRKLKPEELKNGTFTISSLGKLGGLMATPIINHPQTAILGVHKMRKLPRYINDQLLPRYMLNLSISLDHRIIDGLEAARFVQSIKEQLEGLSESLNGDAS